MMAEQQDKPAGGDQRTNDHWRPLFVVTMALLVAFGVLIVVMMATADTDSEIQWQRQVFLFGAAEAIVFTAVGWLFGREVHRTEAISARKDAEEAKKTAEQSAEEAKAANQEAATKAEEAAVERTKGAAVKAARRSMGGDGRQGGAGAAQVVGMDGGGAPAGDAVSLARMVDELWPD
jgi:hypothetical protein